MNTKNDFEVSAVDSKFFSNKININSFERIIYHCPECYNLPLITINSEVNKVSSKCDKNHRYDNISIYDLYQKLIDTSISLESKKLNKNVVCFKCKKSYEQKDLSQDLSKALEGFGFCHGCENIICFSCTKDHEENEKKKDPTKHKTVPLDKYINYCPLHRNRYSAYCLDCKKNTCIKCTEHKQHKKYHFDDYLLFEEDVKKYKKNIDELRNSCDKIENQMYSFLDKIRNNFHEQIQKYNNILMFNEFLLDAYQTNQFNYFYLQNVLNNLTNLETVEKQISNNDIKSFLINMINNISLVDIKTTAKFNEKTSTKINNIDYNKDSIKKGENPNPTFGIEENKYFNNNKDNDNNNNINNNDTNIIDSIKENNEITQINNNFNTKEVELNNKSKKSFKESLLKKDLNINQSYNKELNHEDINLNNISIKSLNFHNLKNSCEFIGKINVVNNFKLKELPNNIETEIEFKNHSNFILPKGCYLYDENNCSSLMLMDNVINCLEPGKSTIKKIKFELYIYSKGDYNVKLAIKDPYGNYISNNKFDFSLIIE